MLRRELICLLVTVECLNGILSLICEPGEYEHGDRCTLCPSPCSRCINNLICTACKPGFYGETCMKQCSESCNEQKCLQENGQCLSCVRGHYFGGNKSCSICPNPCTDCLSENKCTSCKVGFMGNLCTEECINCRLGSGCNLETGVCISGCKDGYSGHTCLTPCDSKCQSCERINGHRCTVCAKGRYGENCEKICPVSCKNKNCNYDNHTCTDGCKEGYWGDRCEHTCPKQCLGGICSRNNGSCSYGCRGNFTGSRCLCPDECECSKEGVCEKCSNQSDYLCDNLCRTACVENICVRGVQTKCLYGYREGYYGSLCKLESRSSAVILTCVGIIVALGTVVIHIVIIQYRKRKKSRSQRYTAEDTNKTTAISKMLLVSRQNSGTEEDPETKCFVEKAPKLQREIKTSCVLKDIRGRLESKSAEQYRKEFQLILDRTKDSQRQNVVQDDDLNASFIDGFRRKKAYIVCKAPTENFDNDFWKVVWKERCEIIVRLSEHAEHSENRILQKIADYFQHCEMPEYTPTYGLTVTAEEHRQPTEHPRLEKKEHSEGCGAVRIKKWANIYRETYCLADIAITTGGDVRNVIQVRGEKLKSENKGHKNIANLLMDVKELDSETNGPLLVCSRNAISPYCGIYIALDIMVDELKSTNQVDIVKTVTELLQQRPDLITTVEYYQYLHKALLVYVDDVLTKKSPFWNNRCRYEDKVEKTHN